MAKAKTKKAARPKHANGAAKPAAPSSLTAVVLHGFKSFRDETRIAIRPLTLLAGANSSGKSSAIQPLLLLKQTQEVGYDPGPLLLNGTNVKFTAMDQLLWSGKRPGDRAEGFAVGITAPYPGTNREGAVTMHFSRAAKGSGVALTHLDSRHPVVSYSLRETMSEEDVQEMLLRMPSVRVPSGTKPRVRRTRCALSVFVVDESPSGGALPFAYTILDPFALFAPTIGSIIHIPGLRGNPERAYPTSQVGDRFPGLFQEYVASILAAWKQANDPRLNAVGAALAHLGLGWTVNPRALDDARVELRVGRLPSPQRGGAADLVNIADVGFGVSQTLPVVVALLAAAPGQVVYLEQPEIHLHPRAQVALAGLLLDAAKRGVVVIAETHSDLLLRSVQRAVAAGEADPSLVALHWFERDDAGATHVTSAELDAAGTYGDWPVDFDSVDLDLERSFLSASLGHPT